MKNTLQDKYLMYIGGEFVEASNGQYLESTNPANGEKLASFPNASKEDVDRAVRAAREAFQSFRRTTAAERAALLEKIAVVIETHCEELATIETLDNGKPIRETSAVDIPMSADHFRYFAAAIRADEGSLNVIDETTMSLVIREPLGVVGQIVPWNFPFLMVAWKLAPALAAGDCVVLKPSSSTSLSVLHLMTLLDDVLPKGVVNVVTGAGSQSGEYLKQHPDLDKLAFTGSTQVGREIAIAAAERLIPATLELGGKSANIIFDDCDLEQAIDGVQMGILFNQGQVCCAGSRIFVQESIYDNFVKRASEKFSGIRIGDPLNPETVMGSQINERQVEGILRYIDIAKQEGAKILVGGERYSEGDCAKGAFMQPTLIVDVRNDMCVAQEEIFGPVAVVIPFKDEKEVIELANDSVYGLGGAVFTKDIQKALSVSRQLETGRVWINCYNRIPAGAPFGGYKQSGIGRETHKMILDSYMQTKNLMIDMTGKASGFYDSSL
ncbi:MAG: aldehyde dehydrogenase family protein [Eubacteriales bacterium]|nr:aldehyde dehydrogenase family protein [Eubacteriales bacterium]